jgi:predicted RNA-binding Zn-ribbon protein involved in translation (DUF1610 family)
MEGPMERLIFTCPTTGKKIDIGVETEIGTLLRIRTETVRAACPACGEPHEWSVNDASLNPTALS